ncbi:MAG: autotransporter domain-containing protein [Candidatus Competibacteraceae bacterium]|nr:autotransporter domain-containing protein [Candidatus Competibacteraceae bacterium]
MILQAKIHSSFSKKLAVSRYLVFFLALLASLAVSPHALAAQTLSGDGAFGSLEVGQSSNKDFTFTTDSSSSTDELSSISVSVSGNGFRLISENCPSGTEILFNASCSITVQFSPAITGAATGTLRVDYDSCFGRCPGSQEINLSGTGILPPDPLLEITSPAEDITITEGESVDFAGMAESTNICLPVSFLWDFDGGAQNSTLESPGTTLFEQAGTYNVSFSASYATQPNSRVSCPVDTLMDTVKVTVLTRNKPPEAVDDSAETLSDTIISIDVLANDSDPDQDTLTLLSVTQPPSGQGSVQIIGAQLQYNPQGFIGQTSFSYTVSDGELSDSATVTVSVSAEGNHPPEAVRDSSTTSRDQPVLIDVLANDSDPDGDPVFIQSVNNPSEGKGSAEISNGQILYTPGSFIGLVRFVYVISDGDLTDLAEVTVRVTAETDENNPPTAVDDPITLTEGQSSITFNPLANDTDPDQDSLTVTITAQPVNGTAVVNPDNTITYTAGANFPGMDSFVYQIDDGRGGSADALVTITGTAIPPTPIDQISLSAESSVREGQTLTVTVTRQSITRATDQPLSIGYRTVAGTATAGDDFTAVNGTFEWAANDFRSQEVTVKILADGASEEDETFAFELFDIPDDIVIEGESRIEITISNVKLFSGRDDLTDNQRELATALDELCPTTDSQALQSQCDELAQLPDSELPDALDQIIPDEIAAMQVSATTGVHFFIDLLQDRATALRAGKRGLDLDSLTLTAGDQSLPLGKLTGAFGQELSGGSAGNSVFNAEFGRLGVFFSGRVVFGEQDDTAFESGYDFDTLGLLGGVDYRISDQFVLGGALGYLNTDSDFNNDGGQLDTTGWTAAVYGTYYFNNQWYIDGAMQYGWNDYDSQRNITFGSNDTAASGSTDGDQFAISLNAGADFFRDAWLLSPYLGLDYITASVDEFSESGGAGLALTVTTEDIDILTSKLGVRVSRSYSMSWGILSPTAFAEWAHEFKDDSREITSRFVADPSVPFTTSTDDPDRNYFNLGLGASATFTEGRSGFINYRGRFGDSDYQSNTIEAGMRFEF